MIQELWGLFPRLMEQNINGLLDQAEPSPARAFQLYKSLKREGLWLDSYQQFLERIEEFYSVPRAKRKKSDFDRYLEQPMDDCIYENFHLNFRSAEIPEKSIDNLASWAHHLIRVSKKTSSPVISSAALFRALVYITNPQPYEKVENIEFQDFCKAWEKAVGKLYGLKHDPEFNELLGELNFIDSQLKESAKNAMQNLPAPLVYLSQSEIDWTIAVRQSAYERSTIPKYSNPRGAQKLCLLELERVISLYRIVQVTKDPDLIKHRENIRTTILDRCDRLLAKQLAEGEN